MTFYANFTIVVLVRALYQNKQKPWNSNQNCTKGTGLIKRQKKMCRQNLDLMETMVDAAYVSVDNCQNQFADRRWNCSSVRKTPKLSKELVRGKSNFILLKTRIVG